ncbi:MULTISPECIES: alpha-E domain-containing protein [Ectothiorhodospira]|uniref:alpha-E domain-containing protein n=1 Tax=Ectothiorhodospira TaxID=1051 RepID=UPI00058CC954|nr:MULTISPECIES: alpha-E domain-containing protein [Ectothiorhodospira]MCG5511818.1 alpha-E domain-containing protein [Ectothiorhodospira shaposhnikovii]
MLSRVAERLYWMARYIERAENTARMVTAFNHLALDMPRSVRLSWRGMVSITGNESIYEKNYRKYDERNVVKFLLADDDNPGSILNALRAARENVRTTRDLVPSEVWETVNELYHHADSALDTGMSKRGRYQYLVKVISHCQQLTGMLAGTMSHDAAYDFIRAGRNLERADMTTRLLDVGAMGLLSNDPQDEAAMAQFESLLWVNILKSLSAFQMYRQHVRRRVNGEDVLKYIFQDREFPRAVAHALGEVEISLTNLPRNETPLRLAIQVRRHVMEANVDKLLEADELHRFIDQLQQEMNELHDMIADTWFSLDRAA